MISFNKEKRPATINFNEEKHEYNVDGIFTISVTQILQRAGISQDLSNVPPQVLEKARLRGLAIHKQVEDALMNNNYDSVSNPAYIIIEYVLERTEMNASKLFCEEMFYCKNDILNYCGRIDIVEKTAKNEIYLFDIKTSRTWTKQQEREAQWQLSLYAYGLKKDGYDVKDIKVVRIDDNNQIQARNLKIISDDEIELLLKTVKENKKFEMSPRILASDIMPEKVIDFFIELNKKQEEIKQAEEKLKEIKQQILNYMREEDIYETKTEDERLIITRTRDSESKIIDSEKLKQEEPDIYKSYLKTIHKNGSVKIIINNK